jgi:hypothetical protein
MVAMKVITGARPDWPSDATHFGLSKSIWSLMQACWAIDSDKRPSASFVLNSIDDNARVDFHHDDILRSVDEAVDGIVRMVSQ